MAIKCVKGYGIYAWYAWTALISTSRQLSLSLSLAIFIRLTDGYIGYLHRILAHCSLTHFVRTSHPSIRRLFAALLASCVLAHSSLLTLYHNQRGTNNTQKKGITLFSFFFSHTCLHSSHTHNLSLTHPLTPLSFLCSIHNSPHSTPFHIQFRKRKKEISSSTLQLHISLSLSFSLTHLSLTHTLTLGHPHHVSPFFLSCFLIILSTPLQYGGNHTDPVVFAFFCTCV